MNKIRMTYTISVTYNPYDLNGQDEIDENDIESIAEIHRESAMEDPEEFFNICKKLGDSEVEEDVDFEII